MPRADRNYPDLWFGLPGKLIKLPYPRDGVEKPYERQTFDFVTGSGNHQVSSLSTGSRIFDLKWKALHLDSFSKLDQYRIGANGPGPWILVDPSMPNLCPLNVGSATGLYNNATHFISDGGAQGTVGSNSTAAFVHRANGWRSIRWRWLTTPATTCTLGMAPLYRGWPGQPCVPGLSYAFSSWMTPDTATDASVTVSMRIQWLDSAGSAISEISSGDTAVTAWQRLSVVGVAPSNAVYMQPRWYAVGSSLVNGTYMYIDEPLLEQDTVVNDWAPSTGIKPLEIVALSDVVPGFASRFRQGVQLQLREMAR